MAMSELSVLRNKRSAKISEKRRCEVKIEEIEEKLTRMRSAKEKMTSFKADVLAHKNGTKGMKDDVVQWEGDKKNHHLSEAEALSDELESYYRDTDKALDSICDVITSLENEKIRQAGILGGIISAINSIGNEIEKLLN